MAIGHHRIRTSALLENKAAVSPLFEEWLERRHGVLTYRLTQVLPNHRSSVTVLIIDRGEETPVIVISRSPGETLEHTKASVKGSSPPEQNQTRAYGASRSARASKSQTTTDGAQ
ncbi:hypothetical protein SFRURICE_012814 [Spodoptera frugiperda]|nr:hypothetical protein SFRURICE_012814 [Spodoptera frugiperda]